MNLAGVEIILNMREKMSAMQRQIEEFVTQLNQRADPARFVHSRTLPGSRADPRDRAAKYGAARRTNRRSAGLAARRDPGKFSDYFFLWRLLPPNLPA